MSYKIPESVRREAREGIECVYCGGKKQRRNIVLVLDVCTN